MIHIPYTDGGLRQETETWAKLHGGVVRNVSGSRTAYWEALCDWWADGDPLVIVEQDILPAGDVVELMQECPSPWCCSPYPIFGGLQICMTGLGCTKFSVNMRTRHPDMALVAGEPHGESEPRGVWQCLDTRLTQRLLQHGYRPHPHAMSQHLHEYDEASLVAVRETQARIQERATAERARLIKREEQNGAAS